VVDGTRDLLSGAEIVWSSSEPRLASIDAKSGQVRGYAPGSVTISARSGSRTARTHLTVFPADVIADTPAVQGYETEYDPPEEPPQTAAPVAPVSPPESRDADRRRLNAAMLSGVEQCYNALRAKDLGRVAELYRPATKSDEDKLGKLTRILRTEEWRAVVGKRVDGTRQLGTKTAAMEFGFELVWKDAFGGRLTSRPVFRAEFAKNGEEWEITSCRIVGSPNL
jgi:hypothetical protein